MPRALEVEDLHTSDGDVPAVRGVTVSHLAVLAAWDIGALVVTSRRSRWEPLTR